jgi:hypothetical protein
MKAIFTILLCLMLCTVKAQWLPAGATTGNIYYNNGNVGLGTSSPSSKLDVNGSIQLSASSKFPMGILTETDQSTFTLLNLSFNFRESNKNTTYKGAAFRIDSRDDYPLFQWIKRDAGVTQEIELMNLSQSGNLGIGTFPNSNFKLAVAGNVIAEAVVIQMRANWPDYVFESTYRLPSLTELEKFIITHKHLPEVPSAKEVEQGGVNVGEINLLLLKKVEELTLYIIELEKKNQAFEKEQKSVEERLNALEGKQK